MVLSFGLSYVKHAGDEGSHQLHIGGLGLFDGSQNGRHHAAWPAPRISPGDEVTIRILPSGDLEDDSNTIAISYFVDGDPEFRGYCVTLRNWEIVEVCMTE